MQIFSTVGELPTPSAERLSNRGDLLLIPLTPQSCSQTLETSLMTRTSTERTYVLDDPLNEIDYAAGRRNHALGVTLRCA